jgi:hypothetical protein
MARKLRAETAVQMIGVRALQVARFRSRLDRLPTSSDVYDFSAERDQLRQRIAALEAGEDVQLQTWELADELLPMVGLRSRFDRSAPRVFRIAGDSVVPDQYERVGAHGSDE